MLNSSSKKDSKKKETSKKPAPKSSPRKSIEGQKFKSAEFIESSDGSSDSDDDAKEVLCFTPSVVLVGSVFSLIDWAQ